MNMERPPRLFIYFKHLIKVIQPMKSVCDPSAADESRKILMCCDATHTEIARGWKFVPRDNELWIIGIGPKHMVRHIIAKTHVALCGQNFLGLNPGCDWTAMVWPSPQKLKEVFLAFRPWAASKDSELLLPEDLIHRIYDMANRRFVHTKNM